MHDLDKENGKHPVRKGYLLVPAWALVRKSWSRKFCALFDTSPQGVRRLELFDSEDHFERGSGGKILVLEDAVKVQTMSRRENATHAHHKDAGYNLGFEITTEKRTIHLRAESAAELQEWVNQIRQVAFPDKQNLSLINACNSNNINSKAHENNNNNSSSINNNNNNNDAAANRPNGYAVNENDLYGAVEDTFCVKLVSTPASERCGLDPAELNYVIVLTAESMMLKYGDLNSLYANDEQTDQLIFEWNYAYIRRYGIVSGFFSFEAGRKCPSGEGLFSFDAPDVRRIFECLASYMKLAGEKRRQLKNGTSSTSSCSSPPPITAVGASTTTVTSSGGKSDDLAKLTSHARGGSHPVKAAGALLLDAQTAGTTAASTPVAITKADTDTANTAAKVTHDENCEGCRKLGNGDSAHEGDPITFGRACAVPQTPVSASTALYANVSDLELGASGSGPAHARSIVIGGQQRLQHSSPPTGARGQPRSELAGAVAATVKLPVEHIVVGDGVEYACIVKTQQVTPPPPPPPPPPPVLTALVQKAAHSVPAAGTGSITRMESVETLDQGC